MHFHDIFNIYTLLVIEISEIVYGKVFTSKNRNAPSKTSNIIQLCVAKWDINMSRALSIYFVRLISCLVTLMHSSTIYMHISITSLLTHTVAHSTGPSFRLKTNNQPFKKFLSLSVSWVKVVKNGKISTFKVNFLCKILSKFSLKNVILGAHFLMLTFFENFNSFKPLCFLKWHSIFDDFYSTEHKT